MNKLLLISLLLTGCTIPVKIVPSDDNLSKVQEIVQNQGQALQEIIKVLKEKQIIGGEASVKK
jgi:hypothetical protein